MRELIDSIINDKVQRIESALSSIKKNACGNVIRRISGLDSSDPVDQQPSYNTQASPEESAIIEKILNKIKDFVNKIQGSNNPQEKSSSFASTKFSALDEQTKQKYYQSFINWVKTSLKPYLDSKQTSNGKPIDKLKIIHGLKSRISAELPEWKDFIFQPVSDQLPKQPASAKSDGIVTSQFLFDESVLSSTEESSDIVVARLLTDLEIFAAEPVGNSAKVIKENLDRDFIVAIDAHSKPGTPGNPKKKSDAAVARLNSILSNKISSLMQQYARSVEEKDLPAFIVKNAAKEIQASATAYAEPITQEIDFIHYEFSKYTRKKGVNIPFVDIQNDPNFLDIIHKLLTRFYGRDVLDPVAIGTLCLGSVSPSVTTPQEVLDACFAAAGNVIVSIVGPKLGKQPAQNKNASSDKQTQMIIKSVLNGYFDKFVYVASNLANDCSIGEIVYALTGNAPSDPYNRLVSDFITYRFSDTKKADELIEEIQPIVQENPEMMEKFFQDYAEYSQNKVEEFQQSTGISDAIINSVLKDKLLDETSLKELRRFISDTVKNETENEDPEGDNSEVSTKQEKVVEKFVEESGVSPEMTAVIVNSEINKVVRNLFSDVTLEDQIKISQSEEALEKIFSYLDTEIKKIDKRYSKSNIMLLFDPEKGGFYTKEISEISSEEKENIQGKTPSSNPIQPLDTPGDEELTFPSGNEFGGGNTKTQQQNAQPQQQSGGSSEQSEFEKALM